MSTLEEGRVVGVASARGPRRDNQDCTLTLPELGVYAVADGMGGLADGRASAEAAVASVRAAAPELVARLRRVRGTRSGSVADLLEELIWSASDAVRSAAAARHAPARPPRSGCTLTVAIIIQDALYVAHIGDSRAYIIDTEGVQQLTDDHSVAAARVRRGRMTEAAARTSPLRNKLYQAIGLSEELAVDILEVDLQPGDRLVLCSDGLWERVTGSELHGCVVGRFPSHACKALLRAAEQRGLVDNTTVLVVDPRRTAVAIDKPGALRRSELFADFGDVELMRLVPYFDLQTVHAGDVVVQQGAPADSLYVLGAGAFDVTRGDTVLTTLTAPGHFGEIALLRSSRRTATVRAAETGWVMRLHRDPIQQLIQRQPVLGARLTLRLARHLADRVVDLTERLAAT